MAKYLEENKFFPEKSPLSLVHPEAYLSALHASGAISKEVFLRDIYYYFDLKDEPEKTSKNPVAYGEKFNRDY